MHPIYGAYSAHVNLKLLSTLEKKTVHIKNWLIFLLRESNFLNVTFLISPETYFKPTQKLQDAKKEKVKQKSWKMKVNNFL